MWLILLISVFNVDQNKIDKALEIIRPYYNEVITTQYPQIKYDFCPAGMNQFARDIIIEYSRDDIVVGDEPAETLYIAGYFYNDGNIVVINDGVVILDNADFHLDGNIILCNQGLFTVDSSTFTIVQHYIYEHGIMVCDSADFSMMNSETDFSGYQISIDVQGYGDLVMANVVNHDWITAVVSGFATSHLNHVDYMGEWLFINDCFARFQHVDYLITWYFLEDSSVVDISFPGNDTVYGFYFDSTLSNVSGIGYHVEIDSSTDCLWATIPLKGSDVTVRDSDLRLTGLMFEGIDSFAISGLVNGLLYEDYTLPVPDRNYHLINTSVQTWNLYPNDTSYVELTSSIFGELCGFGNSYTLIQSAFCDGSGGHIEASSEACVLVILSSIFADVITKDRGICFLGYCAMPWGNIWATGASVMVLVNTQFPEDPIPSDTAIVFVAGIDAPSNANTEDTVGIIGSAWIDTGPYHPFDFDFYRLFYRLLGDSTWIPIDDEQYIEVRRDTLDYWNTVGLAPGTYEVRLVVKDNASDSVEALKQIRLRPMGIVDVVNRDLHLGEMAVKQVAPRIFYITTFDAKPEIYIYDILGRQIHEIKTPELYWTAPASGIYFIQDKKNTNTRKIVAY